MLRSGCPGNEYLIAFHRGGQALKISVPDLDESTLDLALRGAFPSISIPGTKPESKSHGFMISKLLHSVSTLDDVRAQNASGTGRHFLHASGFNRWSDKSIQFSICDDGISATITENTMLDGVTFLRSNDFVTKAITTFNPQDPANFSS
ncbi:hypothetical protein NHQ30_006487 [Ciborinia camelliae]|nr:hypothetical protein NHQ30_006487 [Ciborinia camelliae]